MIQNAPWWNRDQFERFTDLPNESTLEVNVTHEQLSSLEAGGKRVTALSPTRYEEGKSTNPNSLFPDGYDIRFSLAKEMVFQHKAPKKTVVRGQDNRNKRLWLQYNVDMMQVVNLALQYNPRQAFLVLPVIPSQGLMNLSLSMSIFVDVWKIFSKLRRQNLVTSYLLVEYAPLLYRCFRPRYSSKGKLSKSEYYSRVPKVRGKHPGKHWAMKYQSPDPYYDIQYSSSFFAPSTNWDAILPRFKKNSLLILDFHRTDGGEEPNEEWFDLEIPEIYAQEYRNHLKRKYAFQQYLQSGDRSEPTQIAEWIITNVDHRYEQAVQQEVLSPTPSEVEESRLPEETLNYRKTVGDYLQQFRASTNSVSHKIEDTKRIVWESGEENEVNLMI